MDTDRAGCARSYLISLRYKLSARFGNVLTYSQFCVYYLFLCIAVCHIFEMIGILFVVEFQNGDRILSDRIQFNSFHT